MEGGGTPLGLGLHPLLRPGGAEGGARRQTVGEEDASAGLTCGDWTCSALSTLSITQIIRSEKRRGRGEAGVDDGIDGWMCPWESRCAAILGADKCQKHGTATESRATLPSLTWTSALKQLSATFGVGFSQNSPNNPNSISAQTEMFYPYAHSGAQYLFVLYACVDLSDPSCKQIILQQL